MEGLEVCSNLPLQAVLYCSSPQTEDGSGGGGESGGGRQQRACPLLPVLVVEAWLAALAGHSSPLHPRPHHHCRQTEESKCSSLITIILKKTYNNFTTVSHLTEN